MRWVLGLLLLAGIIGFGIQAMRTSDEPGRTTVSLAGDSEPASEPATTPASPLGPSEQRVRGVANAPGTHRISLRLLDAGGRPVAETDLEVEFDDRRGGVRAGRFARTDALGNLAVDVPDLLYVPRTTVTLDAPSLGFAVLSLPSDLPPGFTDLGEVTLSPRLVFGEVLDGRGHAVPDAVVDLRVLDSHGPADAMPRKTVQMRSDERGRFCFAGSWEEGTFLELRARSIDRESESRGTCRLDDPFHERVRLVVRRPGVVDGYVVAPPNTKRLAWEALLLGPPRRTPRRMRLIPGAPGDLTHRFRFENVDPGTYELQIRDPERSEILAHVVGIIVSEGERDGDVRLDRIDLSARTP